MKITECYEVFFLFRLLPCSSFVALHEFLGLSTAMDHFVGRKKDN